MNIYTIFTGGTIGSQLNAGGTIAPDASAPYQLIQLYNEHFPNQIIFHTEEPYRILSENLCSSDLLKLIDSIHTILLQKNPDGIIITHGTDTLQYTAAILGYLFGDSPVPIVLVSSDFVLTDSRANGLINFRYAIQFIQEHHGTGVFVSYCNVGGIPTIHRGTRLQNPLTYCADVSSIADSWYGRFISEKYVSNSNPSICEHAKDCLQTNCCTNPSAGSQAAKRNPTNPSQRLPISFSSLALSECSNSILRIHPYVGMCYPSIPLYTKVILHESYHSGTIRVCDSLRHFCQDASRRQIPIYLVGLTGKEAEYETVEEYRRLGIIPLLDTAVIAQYCKLWLAISNHLDIVSIMSQTIAEDRG